MNDYGGEGVMDTIDGCGEYAIQFVGAGKNIDDATKPLLLTKGNQKVAVLNACENESSIATSDKPGAASIDTIRLYRQIQQLKIM